MSSASDRMYFSGRPRRYERERQWDNLFGESESDRCSESDTTPGTGTLFRILWPVLEQDLRRHRLRRQFLRLTLALVLLAGNAAAVLVITPWALVAGLPAAGLIWWLAIVRPDRRPPCCELCELDQDEPL
ncbi:MAG: hypothetical protein ACOCZK_04615 [Planctomycetota bacterium]